MHNARQPLSLRHYSFGIYITHAPQPVLETKPYPFMPHAAGITAGQGPDFKCNRMPGQNRQGHGFTMFCSFSQSSPDHADLVSSIKVIEKNAPPIWMKSGMAMLGMSGKMRWVRAA
jgi:hypothetical protein